MEDRLPGGASMTDWSKWLGPNAKTAAAPELIRAFRITDPIVDDELVQVDGDAWRIGGEEEPGDSPVARMGAYLARLFHNQGRSVRLFDLADPGKENGLLIYRAKLRTEDVQGQAYLQMWCRLAGRGEFFSKSHGFGQAAQGTTDWATYETPFILQPGQSPNTVRLEVVLEGSGKVWIKDVELLFAPLES
jgi:hypothetical protein